MEQRQAVCLQLGGDPPDKVGKCFLVIKGNVYGKIMGSKGIDDIIIIHPLTHGIFARPDI
jgi:hypothetical protein